jgi:hypothetical protein
MTKSMWTPACQTSNSKIMRINMELVPPFAAITGSTLLGRLSTRCREFAAGTCFHSATKALVRLGPDVRCGRLVAHVDKQILYGPRFVHGALSWWNRKGPSPNCFHKVGNTELSRMSSYAVALRFTFTGTKRPSPNHEKQPETIIPHPPNFTVGTMHWVRWRSPGIL